jgi:hypothetical protein
VEVITDKTVFVGGNKKTVPPFPLTSTLTAEGALTLLAGVRNRMWFAAMGHKKCLLHTGGSSRR